MPVDGSFYLDIGTVNSGKIAFFFRFLKREKNVINNYYDTNVCIFFLI